MGKKQEDEVKISCLCSGVLRRGMTGTKYTISYILNNLFTFDYY